MFSFGFVRNPWARLVSLYHYKHATENRGEQRFGMRFKDWIVQLGEGANIPPQTRFLFSNDGKQLVSYIGHVEKLSEDLDHIGGRIGVSFASLRHLNATEHEDYRAYYDLPTRQIVQRLFAPDIELFGYEF
jgi:hypothetical protein